jgi:hypothetical protein
MATGDWTWFGQGTDQISDWTTATFKVMATTSTFTPNQDTNDFRDDVTNEVTGTGYTAGGVTVSGKTRTYDGTSNERRYVMANNVWGPGATITARTFVLYKSLGGAASADPLIAFLTLAADAVVTNGTLTIQNNATATLKHTVGA